MNIELQDLSQDIAYDHSKLEWCAGRVPQVSMNQKINERKEHPLLRNFFVSIGVEMYYEMMVENAPFWYFSKLSENLVSTGYGQCVFNLPTSDAVHLAVVRSHPVASEELEADPEHVNKMNQHEIQPQPEEQEQAEGHSAEENGCSGKTKPRSSSSLATLNEVQEEISLIKWDDDTDTDEENNVAKCKLMIDEV